MQQGTGGDNLAVRWRMPDGNFEEPIPSSSPAGTRFIPHNGVETLPGIYQQTTNVTAVEGHTAVFSVLVTNGAAVLPTALAALEYAGVALASISVAQPSLDDVYLHHAGRSFGEADRLGTTASRSSEAVAA